MELERTTTEDLYAELAALPIATNEVAVLVQHLRDRFVGHFGAETFDVWLAKYGLSQHSVDELAMVALLKLAPLLARLPEGAVTELAEAGELASAVNFPWEDRY